MKGGGGGGEPASERERERQGRKGEQPQQLSPKWESHGAVADRGGHTEHRQALPNVRGKGKRKEMREGKSQLMRVMPGRANYPYLHIVACF